MKIFLCFNIKLNFFVVGNNFDVRYQLVISGKIWSDYDVIEKMFMMLKIWWVGLEGQYGLFLLMVKNKFVLMVDCYI